MSAETVPAPITRQTPPPHTTKISVAEYMEMERISDIRHEYVNGVVIAMSGESLEHNQIAGNVHMRIELAFGDRVCRVFIENIRVRVSPSQYRYPDVVALCGAPAVDDSKPPVLLNPNVIVEVLSPSTEQFDREGKFMEYRQIGSLTDYVLIEQDHISVVHAARIGPNEWMIRDYSNPDDQLTFAALDVSLTLTDIYRKVTFQSPPAAAS